MHRPIRPQPEGWQTTPQETTKTRGASLKETSSSRRGRTTVVACIPCRKRKTKCNGERPTCHTCTSKDRQDCSYDLTAGSRRPTSLRQIIAAQQVEIQQLRSAVLLLTSSPDRVAAANIARQIKQSGFSHLSLDDVRELLGAEGQTVPPQLQGEKSLSLLEDWMNAQLEAPRQPDDADMLHISACTELTPAPSFENTKNVPFSPPGHAQRADNEQWTWSHPPLPTSGINGDLPQTYGLDGYQHQYLR